MPKWRTVLMSSVFWLLPSTSSCPSTCQLIEVGIFGYDSQRSFIVDDEGIKWLSYKTYINSVSRGKFAKLVRIIFWLRIERHWAKSRPCRFYILVVISSHPIHVSCNSLNPAIKWVWYRACEYWSKSQLPSDGKKLQRRRIRMRLGRKRF